MEKKFLVIQQKMIGDVLTSTILLEALRKQFPDSELHYLINSHTLPVVANNPVIDKVVLFTPEIASSKREFYRLLMRLRKEKYDGVIDAYSKTGSALMSFFTKAPVRVGIQKSYLRFFYTHTYTNKLVRSGTLPLAHENRLQLLTPLGVTIDEPITPKLYLTEAEINAVKKALLTDGLDVEKQQCIMINVLGSSVNKTYPLEYMAQLLRAVTAQFPEFCFVLNYMPQQSEEVKKILELCDNQTKKQLKELNIKGLRNFIVATSLCKAVIGNEGGAIHMGAALQLPTFAIFSPWIRKETWSISDATNAHQSVHLKDYKPELFVNYSQKKFKTQQQILYKAFVPSFFKEKLFSFLKNSTN